MSQIRRAYAKLYFGNRKNIDNKSIKLSKEQIELIDSGIQEIKEIIENGHENGSMEYGKLRIIINVLKKVQNYPLTLEQCEELTNLLMNLPNVKLTDVQKHAISTGADVNLLIIVNNFRKTIIGKFASSIDLAQKQTEDIEELKLLNKKLTSGIVKENSIAVSKVRDEIYSKISNIQTKNAIEKIRNEVPEGILHIIEDLTNGTIDIDKSKEIINLEVQKKLKTQPNNRFSLTEEQVRTQIIIQIRRVLQDKADRFRIKDPEKAIYDFQKLTDNSDLDMALQTVIGNLVATKDFEIAKQILNKFSTGKGSNKLISACKSLRYNIKTAEIGDMILKGIRAVGTPEEEEKYFELIKNGIKESNIDLSFIPLGKSRDGSRNITFQDILDIIDNRRVFQKI